MTSREQIEGGALVLTYNPGLACPSCKSQSWHIGRITAECASCTYALPLSAIVPSGGTHTGKRR